MSAWTELACLLASIFLVSSIDVCLKCFPPLVCQCLSSGSLGFLLKRASRRFSQLLPSVSEQSYSKGTEVFLSICIACLSQCFPCFWWSWYPIFFSLWRMPTGCLPLGLPRFCFKTYQIFFWSSLTQFFIKTVQVQQLASQDTDRSWVGFKDSTGKHKVILTNYLKWYIPYIEVWQKIS